ncbi:MAG: hypothetical protein ACR2NZ_08540, partial [Rubripirellula sp.]
TLRELAGLVAESVGTRKVRQIRLPSVFCWMLASINSHASRLLRLRLLLNSDKMREGMAGSWTCDSSRLTDELGFEFRSSLEDRIRETAKSYQAMGKM